ncbi:MAG: hypothetical protein QW821_05295 [Candidatus Bathyarchaeia archaeon]
MNVTAFNGTKILLTEERWKHIVLRHPELENKLTLILETVANPHEVYMDVSGTFHALRRLSGELSDYLVVIYSKENKEGYIRTAFYTNYRRKDRRYKQFKRLKPS